MQAANSTCSHHAAGMGALSLCELRSATVSLLTACSSRELLRGLAAAGPGRRVQLQPRPVQRSTAPHSSVWVGHRVVEPRPRVCRRVSLSDQNMIAWPPGGASLAAAGGSSARCESAIGPIAGSLFVASRDNAKTSHNGAAGLRAPGLLPAPSPHCCRRSGEDWEEEGGDGG